MPVISHEHRVVYFPIPKNATSSMKRLMYQLDTSRSWDQQDRKKLGVKIHMVYPAEQKFSWLTYFEKYTSIVIVRDPVSRVLATYGNRVVHAKALTGSDNALAQMKAKRLNAYPELDEFVDRLKDYQAASKIVRNHTRTQTSLVGEFWSRITHRLTIEKVGAVPGIIESCTGRKIELPHSQRVGPKYNRDDLSQRQLKKIEALYREDYALLKDIS